jgi:hypothetical protein
MTSFSFRNRIHSLRRTRASHGWTRSIARVLVACLLFALATLTPGTGHAASSTSCQISSVLLQGRTTGVPNNDLLLVSCTDGTSYVAYIGTPGTGCYSSSDAVKGWETLALSASLSGRPITVWWNQMSCPSNSTARVISSLIL